MSRKIALSKIIKIQTEILDILKNPNIKDHERYEAQVCLLELAKCYKGIQNCYPAISATRI